MRLAEEACRAFRQAIGAPVCLADTRDKWTLALDILLRWQRLAGKKAYKPPTAKGIRKPKNQPPRELVSGQ